MSRPRGNRNQHQVASQDDLTPRERERLAAEYALWREQRYAHLRPDQSNLARTFDGQRRRGNAVVWHLAALEEVIADRRARREKRRMQAQKRRANKQTWQEAD